MILPRGSALLIEAPDPLATPPVTSLQWNKLTEHNRSEITIGTNRIESARRMANGSLRKYHVADKKTFSVSWRLLPGTRAYTVDNYWGAEDLREFYSSALGRGSFNIRLNLAKAGTNQESSGYESYTVVISDCSFVLVRRGIVPHWDVSLTLEEV